jgi:endonuclease/exonuclease/phosphatase family metal-dependent hydrolase
MDACQIKLMSLNIHNYHDFKRRKPRIVALIKKYAPDVVALQEVRDDRRKNKVGENQAKQLNKELKFKHFKFLRVNNINKVKGIAKAPSCYEGLAILSKFHFSSGNILLKKRNGDKYYRKVLTADIKIGDKMILIWVVHFSNNDLFARLHSEETLAYAKSTKPIILGDFNIKNLSELKKLAAKNDYTSSSDYKHYISFPDDKGSYDYIFLPKRFSFSSFRCIPDKVSDHKALFAKINL